MIISFWCTLAPLRFDILSALCVCWRLRCLDQRMNYRQSDSSRMHPTGLDAGDQERTIRCAREKIGLAVAPQTPPPPAPPARRSGV
jgi:hypothetical protein